ncbi:MAG TPA: hypothetical protein VK249_18680 [Anaerolineales bacterium]|nr:hypothetical protein [Anaerolineales bacterium]
MKIEMPDENMSGASQGRPGGRCLRLLRATAPSALVAGAAGSSAFTLYAGRHNASRILIMLFVIWILSPLAVLVLANLISKRWSVLTRGALYGVKLVISLDSLVIYGAVALWPPKEKMAFVFLVVPPVSWLLIAIVVSVAAVLSNRLSRRSGGP